MAQAFGLEVRADPAPDGLAPGPAPRSLDVRVLADGRASSMPEVTLAHHDRTDRVTVVHDDEHGWRVGLAGHGSYRLAGNGRQLTAHLPAATWTPPALRLLFAQVLPLAATLQGVELLHAAAVALEGRVVAVVAGSGRGKTTTARALTAFGAIAVTDDALALEVDDGALVAHPGPRYGDTGDGHGPLSAEGVGAPLPLGALVFLDRDDRHGAPALIPAAQPLAHVLASTFVPYVAEGTRQARLLALAEALVRTVPVLRLQAGLAVAPRAIAATIRDGWRGGPRE